jgi:hypothetical protein
VQQKPQFTDNHEINKKTTKQKQKW